MILAQAAAADQQVLSPNITQQTLEKGLAGRFSGQRVLVLIPDHTRTIPLPMLFRSVVGILEDVQQLDFMVALGTHSPHSPESLNRLVGITADERAGKYQHIELLNHAWDSDDALEEIGQVSQEEVKAVAGPVWHPTLGGDVPIQLNRRARQYDHIMVLGPTFPHEIVGFSGGAKYFFPGISGPEIIHVSHWLGALIGVANIIGVPENPVRALLHKAMAFVDVPVTLVGLVVEQTGLAGIFIGDYIEAWRAAVALSAKRHITWLEKPVQQVLSWAPTMYDELWTGAKAIYKLEPAVAPGGELIVYAPHIDTVSFVHGKYIYEIGFHVRDYFLQQWDQYKHIPLGILGHSTQVRGGGRYENGVEIPNIRVTLASKIPKEDCEHLGLGYQDPNTIHPEAWANREDEGILFVRKAGEQLYRLAAQRNTLFKTSTKE